MSESTNILSVVIPCRNEEEYIAKCLDSIINCDFPKEQLKVFVCDGLSDDMTVRIVEEYSAKFGWIELIHNHKKTTPFALNLGIKASESEFVTILGAHAEVGGDYFSKCVDDFSQAENIGCTGGLLENVFEDAVSEAIGYAQSHPFGVGNAHFRTGSRSGLVDTVAFGTYKREVFDSIGYFDEELARNQDDEFNYRLLKNGYKIWLNTSAKAKYYVRGSFKKLWKQYFQYGYWKVFVNRKHKAVTTWRQLVPAGMVLWVLFSLILRMFSETYGNMSLILFTFYLNVALVIGFLFFLKRYLKGNREDVIKHYLSAWQVWLSFLILHFSYGLGYLKGIWQFLILRKNPSSKSEELTR